MDEKTYKRINLVLKLLTVIFVFISGYVLFTGYMTIEVWFMYLLYFVLGVLGLFFVSWVIYKLFLEKYHYRYKAGWTEEFLANELPSEIAVVGDRRGGKDTLATAMVRYNADAFFNEIEKELKNLKNNILYIFDFKKLDRYLSSKHAKKLLMNVPKRIKRERFKRVFYDNRAFLKGRYMKKYNGETRKLARKFIMNKKSGLYYDNKVKKVDYFDLLMDYIEGYIRIYVIEQMVISNQPFMELLNELDGVDLSAKKLSYEYFKIKIINMFPWIKHLITFDTEATLYWNNSDDKSNRDNKGTNGALEFFVGKGHFLKKFKYITTIQTEDRAQAWFRELFELRIFLQGKFKMKITSPVRRFFKRFGRGFYKVVNFLIFRPMQRKRVTAFLQRVSSEHPRKALRILAKIFLGVLVYPIYFTDKRIEKLTQREEILYMESMLEFNVSMQFRNNGESFVHRSIRTLSSRGFNGHNVKTKLVIPILESWPYFSTEHLGDAGDRLMELSKTKFSEIPEWDKNLHFDLSIDGEHLQHKLYEAIRIQYEPGYAQKVKAKEKKKGEKEMMFTEEIKKLLEDHRDNIKIGSIVSVFDKEHPEYMEELFFVYGFQLDIEGNELIVALMDSKLKTFVTHIDNIILKDLLSIDDMFPPEPTDIMIIQRKEQLRRHEV